LTADALFVVQLGCAIAFGGGQALNMLHTTAGVSISWLVFWGVFLLINMRLSFQAHQAAPSRVTAQTVAIYITWTSLLAVNLCVLVWRATGRWNDIDTLTSVLALAGVTGTLVIGARHQLGWRDPIVRGWLAVFFKAVPQLTLALNMVMEGSDGISAFGVWAGHVTICTRIGQLIYGIREAGWDRYRRGSLISELANEASWFVATIVWLLV
jgi:hypothetical protein